MKPVLLAIILSISLLAAACEPVQDPWTRSEDQLEQERSRSPEADQKLRHRFMNVQTDR